MYAGRTKHIGETRVENPRLTQSEYCDHTVKTAIQRIQKQVCVCVPLYNTRTRDRSRLLHQKFLRIHGRFSLRRDDFSQSCDASRNCLLPCTFLILPPLSCFIIISLRFVCPPPTTQTPSTVTRYCS